MLQRLGPHSSLFRSVEAELDMVSLSYGHPNTNSPHALVDQVPALPLDPGTSHRALASFHYDLKRLVFGFACLIRYPGTNPTT